jgi:rhamnose utilization protein RhaD (predicted bifunctional aldolase and dehydrogenase)/NAD(P)-dependent dehydrogenase (short-subunit alcohol dehydrogenase family)
LTGLWDDAEAARHCTELALRVYSSQLLGRDPSLVLHGGGNTSVKVRETNVLGEAIDVLYVKGSGSDLATIQDTGFAPVRLDHLQRLAQLQSLSDPQMVSELATHVLRPGAPAPSVETILHAILPFQYVDHTHADAVLAVTNTADGAARVREVYRDDVVVIPYVMPGFELARLCAQEFPRQAHAGTLGMVLLNHGIFSFGHSALESYQRMVELVGRAEEYLARHRGQHREPQPAQYRAQQGAPEPSQHRRAADPASGAHAAVSRLELAQLRSDLSACAGFPMIFATHSDPKFLEFAGRPDLDSLSQQGPVTPDHVIRTKRVPMLGRDVDAYAARYREYFSRHAAAATPPVTMLDPAPRVVIDPAFGLGTAGRTVREAGIARDLYAHTIQVILDATALGGYRALPEADLFAVEYWDLEQAKLRKAGAPPAFAGEVALVTGAASGIGKACVDSLLRRGAAVIALDINPDIAGLYARPEVLALPCDVTDGAAIQRALDAGVRTFGGLDMLVLNAGMFPGGRALAALADAEFRQVMQVNLDANLSLLRETHPLLKLAPRGGRVVIIGSKNVPAPGPGAGAYSASKAALTQLARVAALEWGADGIRVNTLHPDAVFDTGLWSPEVLAARAQHYGVSVAEYRKRNVLKVEVHSRDVAELAAEMCGPLFAKTTGAQVPVDGGNERVI